MTTKQQIIDRLKSGRPISDRILVIPDTKQKETASGLLTADAKMGEDVKQVGTVIAVGPGRVYESGVRVDMEVKVGDRVLFGMHAGDTVYVDEAGDIHRGIGDLRDEWLAVKILRQDSVLYILP